MSEARRRRGDFVRATTRVLTEVRSGDLFAAATGARLCDIAAATCGAVWAGLYLHAATHGQEDRIVAIAQTAGEESIDITARITPALLDQALAAGGTLAGDDLLVQAISAATEDARTEDSPSDHAFLVLFCPLPPGKDGRPQAAFTEVDRQRIHILSILAALKEEAAGGTASSTMLARVSHSLMQEPTVDGRLAKLASFLAETTRFDQACVWIRPHVQSDELRLRAAVNPFDETDYETLSQVAEQISLALATSGRYQMQASLAVLDTLTDLPNRRSAEAALEREFERAAREGAAMTIAFLDIDHFKQINDSHGHDAGDDVLREAARMFKAQLRATDYIARWGGEEFLILLPGSDHTLGPRICERIRHSVSLIAPRAARGATIAVTASLGGASFPHDGADRATLLKLADAALYQAKTAGRDCLRWADQPE